MNTAPLVALSDLWCLKPKRLPLHHLVPRDIVLGYLEMKPNGTDSIVHFGYGFDSSKGLQSDIGYWYQALHHLERLFRNESEFACRFPFADELAPDVDCTATIDEVTIRITDYEDELRCAIESVREISSDRRCFETMVAEAIRLIEHAILREAPIIGPEWLANHRRE